MRDVGIRRILHKKNLELKSFTPESIRVTEFRSRREGPESLIQDIVVDRIPNLLTPSRNFWTASSLPVGAGIPDLLVVSYHPEVHALESIELIDAKILAYLRAVGKAKMKTIAERIGISTKIIKIRLAQLVEAGTLEISCNSFSLTPIWRQILPEIVSIEVKVNNWHKAIEQAARNSIFAHLSFIALPEKVADRVRVEPLLVSLGIGLISVSEENKAVVVRKPRRKQPTVWLYYYQIATALVRSGRNNAIYF